MLDRLTAAEVPVLQGHLMYVGPITVKPGEARNVESFLADRIYEHNANATGYFDAESFSAVHRNVAGDIEAGVCGYTWGGSCHITHLWVMESKRGEGLGSALLSATEEYARSRNCSVIHLASHSFQAPASMSATLYSSSSPA